MTPRGRVEPHRSGVVRRGDTFLDPAPQAHRQPQRQVMVARPAHPTNRPFLQTVEIDRSLGPIQVAGDGRIEPNRLSLDDGLTQRPLLFLPPVGQALARRRSQGTAVRLDNKLDGITDPISQALKRPDGIALPQGTHLRHVALPGSRSGSESARAGRLPGRFTTNDLT